MNRNHIVLEVNLTSPLSPDQLPELVRRAEEALPAGDTQGVVLSGRLPVWAFAALAHHYHPTPWVATFDPLEGVKVTINF